jgi:hypothetical protein
VVLKWLRRSWLGDCSAAGCAQPSLQPVASAGAARAGFAPLAHGCCAMYDKRMDGLSVQHKMYTTVRRPFTTVKTNGGAV